MIKYVVVGGHVRSKDDDQLHYISAEKLVELYRLKEGVYKICPNNTVLQEDVNKYTVLAPKYDGNYDTIPEEDRIDTQKDDKLTCSFIVGVGLFKSPDDAICESMAILVNFDSVNKQNNIDFYTTAEEAAIKAITNDYPNPEITSVFVEPYTSNGESVIPFDYEITINFPQYTSIRKG